MTRRCIPIPNGILCASRGSKGPSAKDLAAVDGFLQMIRTAKKSGKELVIIDPKAEIAPVKGPTPKNPALTWQKVHAKDPKRQAYRDALRATVKCDRVSAMATTPSGLSLSGRCSRFGRGGVLMDLGFFQVLAP